MNLLVVDASVAAKWCLPVSGESLCDEAVELLRRYTSQEIALCVPDVFWAEITNVFWKAVRLRRLSSPAATEALAILRSYRLATVPSTDLLELALEIALTFDRSVYDSLYVALAVDSKGHLVTADERLANALAARLPVKWLGSF